MLLLLRFSNELFLPFCVLIFGFLALILLDFTFFSYFHAFAHFSRFSIVLSKYHFIDSSQITFWAFRIIYKVYIKLLKGVYYGFKGFDTPFSKNSIESFAFDFNCGFYFLSSKIRFSSLSYFQLYKKHFLGDDRCYWFLWRSKWAYILI